MNWFRKRWRVVEDKSGFFYVETCVWFGPWCLVTVEVTLDEALDRMKKLANPVRGYLDAEGNMVRTNAQQDQAQ